VPHDRRLREGSDANIEHLVVAADAVYVVDANNLAGSLTTAGDQLRIDGRDRAKRLAWVRRQADEVAAALSHLEVPAPVRPCCASPVRRGRRGCSSPMVSCSPPPDTVTQVVTLPGLLVDAQRDRITDLLAWAFPPAVST
jgi:hypothetical protein